MDCWCRVEEKQVALPLVSTSLRSVREYTLNKSCALLYPLHLRILKLWSAVRMCTLIDDWSNIAWQFCILNTMFAVCHHLKECQSIKKNQYLKMDAINGWSLTILWSNCLYLSSYFRWSVSSGWSNATILRSIKSYQ